MSRARLSEAALDDVKGFGMEINASQVKELRERTGVGMMECKSALVEAGGNVAEAEKILRKRGVAAAAKKAGRATGEGAVGSYIHMGSKIGVLVEVNCETDFAARNEDFQSLVHEIAMHIAAAAPRFVRRDEVPSKLLADEQEIAREQVAKAGKTGPVAEKIVEGKLEKFFQDACLLEQPFVKDPEKTVAQVVAERVARIGENIQVTRFVRYVLGDGAGA